MQLINIASFYCEFCKKNISAMVYTDHLDLTLEEKEGCISMSKNFHWYDFHYNCAVCGKWIESGERELVIEKDFTKAIHHDYINENHGLLRVHKNCIEGGEK